MPNLPHPLEEAQFAIHDAIQKHVSLSMRDGEIDEVERHLYDMLHGVKNALGGYVTRDKLATAIRKGVDPSPYLNHMAHAVGYHIAPHGEEPAPITHLHDAK